MSQRASGYGACRTCMPPPLPLLRRRRWRRWRWCHGRSYAPEQGRDIPPPLPRLFFILAQRESILRDWGVAVVRAPESERVTCCVEMVCDQPAGRNVGWRGKAWSALRVRAAALARMARVGWRGVHSESQRRCMLEQEAPSCTTLAVRHASPRHLRCASCVKLSHDRRGGAGGRFGLSSRGQPLAKWTPCFVLD